MNNLLALDVGTIETGFCIINKDNFKPLNFGKIKNEDVYKIIANEHYDEIAIEQFACYGMPIGESTIYSITWNGRFIQYALDHNIGQNSIHWIYRKDEKMNICGTMKAKDSNIRQALIDRFGDTGTKKNPGWFYGFKKDIWSAYAIGITYLDMKARGELDAKNELGK